MVKKILLYRYIWGGMGNMIPIQSSTRSIEEKRPIAAAGGQAASQLAEVAVGRQRAADDRSTIRKSPNVQSFGIKFERIDRDLLWVYVTAVRRLYI